MIKNKQALSTLSVFFRLKKKDRQQQKEERSREEDRQFTYTRQVPITHSLKALVEMVCEKLQTIAFVMEGLTAART